MALSKDRLHQDQRVSFGSRWHSLSGLGAESWPVVDSRCVPWVRYELGKSRSFSTGYHGKWNAEIVPLCPLPFSVSHIIYKGALITLRTFLFEACQNRRNLIEGKWRTLLLLLIFIHFPFIFEWKEVIFPSFFFHFPPSFPFPSTHFSVFFYIPLSFQPKTLIFLTLPLLPLLPSIYFHPNDNLISSCHVLPLFNNLSPTKMCSHFLFTCN